MPSQSRNLYEFGPFCLDASQKVLLKDGNHVELAPKTFDTLLVLVESAGRVIGKEAFMQRVWPDSVVEEGAITSQVSLLRKILNNGGCFIETVPKRGYRFMGDVRHRGGGDGSLVVREMHTRTHITLSLSIQSIAVLPFHSLAGSGEADDYLRLGLADALTTRFSSVRDMIVRPTSAVLKYGALQTDPVTAGRELRVDSVLTGNFQRVGQRVRISLQLVDVSDGRALWGEIFDEELSNIFAVQDSISSQVAERLVPHLSREERGVLTKQHTDNIEADQLYWKGRLLMNQSVRTPETVCKAIDYFKQAVARDSQFALAFADLAAAYEGASVSTLLPPLEMFPQAQEAVTKALSLDPTLSEAHAIMGAIKWEYEHDWEGAESKLLKAIELNRSNASAHWNYAQLLTMQGRHEEAMFEIERSQQIDPLSSNIRAVKALVLYYARRYEEAAEQAEATLEIDPYAYRARMYATAIYEVRGLYDQALEHVLKGRQLSGGAYPDVSLLARIYAHLGEKRKFKTAFEELKRLAKVKYVDPFAFVIVNEAQGTISEALDWLEKTYEARSYWITTLNVNPHLDRLRSAPGFGCILAKLNFPHSVFGKLLPD
jgi:DNA-binding winged helix-turn-helix (wHTH) protein/tetratricopeptide (TPR) repeat protein